MKDLAGVTTGLACTYSEPLWIDRVTKEPSVKAAHADLVNVVIYSHVLGVSGHG